MIVNTEGIILRSIPYSESSLILKIFTKDYGLLSFLVRGARSKSLKNGGQVLRPLNQIQFSFYNKEIKTLKSIKEYHLLFAPDSQQFGIHKSSIWMFMVEVVSLVIKDEAMVDTEKYHFISYSVDHLRQHDVSSQFYLSFLFQFGDYIGIGQPVLEPKYVEYLSEYQTALNQDSQTRKQLYNQLAAHYHDHLSGFRDIKSLTILEQILQ
jgi:DNA repair protein RecO (recombination protein O)